MREGKDMTAKIFQRDTRKTKKREMDVNLRGEEKLECETKEKGGKEAFKRQWKVTKEGEPKKTKSRTYSFQGRR